MRPVARHLLCFLFLLSVGCSTEWRLEDPPLAAVATLSGMLRHEGTGKQRDYSGATIALEGTSLFGMTDSVGYWKIDSVPAGVYNIIASKPGFDSGFVPGVEVNPPTGRFLERDIQLRTPWVHYYQLKNLRIRNEGNGDLYVFDLTQTVGDELFRSVEVFCGSSRDVSPERNMFQLSVSAYLSGSPNSLSGSVYLSRASLLGMFVESPFRGFATGDSIYFAIFTVDDRGHYPSTGWPRYMNFRRRSNAIGTLFK